MFKALIISSQLIGLLFLNMFYAPREVKLEHDLPNSTIVGAEHWVYVQVDKGKLGGFAKYQINVPEGMQVEPGDLRGASFTFAEGAAKIIWMSLPSENEFEFSYKLIVYDDCQIGNNIIQQKFAYLEKNERKVLNLDDHVMYVDSENLSNEYVPDTLANGLRTITKLNDDHYLIELDLYKDGIKGFAKIEEFIPAGMNAEAVNKARSVFTQIDDKVKFVWFSIPEEEQIKLTYELFSDGPLDESVLVAGKLPVSGEFTYLRNNESRTISMETNDNPPIAEYIDGGTSGTKEVDSTDLTIETPDVVVDNVEVDPIETPDVVVDNVEVDPIETPDVVVDNVEVDPIETPDVVVDNVEVDPIETPDVVVDNVEVDPIETPDVVVDNVEVDPIETPNIVVDNVEVDPIETPDVVVDNLEVDPIETPDIVVDNVEVDPIETPDVVVDNVEVDPIETPDVVVDNLEVDPIETPDVVVDNLEVDPIETPDAIVDNVEVDPIETPNVIVDNVEVDPIETPDIIIDTPDVVLEETEAVAETTFVAENEQAENYEAVSNIPSPDKGISYRVQIMAGKNVVGDEYLKKRHKFTDDFTIEHHKIWVKYTTGIFGVYKDARNKRNHITDNYNFDGPFVTAYNDGSRITVQEALMVSSQKWYQ